MLQLCCPGLAVSRPIPGLDQARLLNEALSLTSSMVWDTTHVSIYLLQQI